jgi:hypothetical protein
MSASLSRIPGLLPLALLGLLVGCDDGFHRYRSVGPPDDGGIPAGGCGSITSCELCTPVRGCGWCTVGGVGRCARSPDQCSPNGAFSWTWVPEGCPGAADGGVRRDGGGDAGADAGAIAPGSTSFKSASADNVAAPAGTTSLLTLSLSAPTAGAVWLSASGTCTVSTALPVAIVGAIGIETGPQDITPTGGAASVEFPAGTTGAPRSFSVTRTLPAQAGANSFYLNLVNPASGGRLVCSAAMTAFFSAQPLP